MELIQLVPTLPPAVSGVGDYATLFARELLAHHGVGTRFVVGDPGWNPSIETDASFPAEKVAARSAEALCKWLGGSGTVLLHYVSYGYAHRGCPFWLVDALERWKRADPSSRRLVLIFHEVYASGPPWSSAFWTSPFQQRLAARLARLADARRITTSISLLELRGTLRRAEKSLPTAVAPVFSNLGEPADPPPLSARERQIVVFGSRLWRERAYADSAALVAFCARENIGRVVDVGAPLTGGVRVGDLEVREAGVLPAAEAGALFADSLAGYFHYPAVHLGKSGIFAAYCAHGLVPVTFPANRDAADGLRAGEHYVAGDMSPGASLDSVAAAALAWYRGHRLAVHAREIKDLVVSPTDATADAPPAPDAARTPNR